MALLIEEITQEDQTAILSHIRELWGDDFIVVHGDAYQVDELAGLKATLNSDLAGFLHYEIKENECEIITLASLREGVGVGTALISELEAFAKANNCNLLSVITTNDNLHALGFYQRRGFHLAALYPGQVDQSRKLKPSIPEIGDHKIPLRDEIRLEKCLS